MEVGKIFRRLRHIILPRDLCHQYRLDTRRENRHALDDYKAVQVPLQENKKKPSFFSPLFQFHHGNREGPIRLPPPLPPPVPLPAIAPAAAETTTAAAATTTTTSSPLCLPGKSSSAKVRKILGKVMFFKPLLTFKPSSRPGSSPRRSQPPPGVTSRRLGGNRQQQQQQQQQFLFNRATGFLGPRGRNPNPNSNNNGFNGQQQQQQNPFFRNR